MFKRLYCNVNLNALLLRYRLHHITPWISPHDHRSCHTKPVYGKVVTYPHEKFGNLFEIYRNPYILYSKSLIRLKNHMLPAMLGITALTAGLHWFEVIDDYEAAIAATGCFIITVKLLLASSYNACTVGFIYLTEDDNLVLSYLDYNGERIDEEFPRKSVRFEPYKIGILNKLMVPLFCTKTKRFFKVHLRKGIFIEEALVDHIGDLPSSAFR